MLQKQLRYFLHQITLKSSSNGPLMIPNQFPSMCIKMIVNILSNSDLYRVVPSRWREQIDFCKLDGHDTFDVIYRKGQDDSDERNKADATCNLIPLFGWGCFIDGAWELGKNLCVVAFAGLGTCAVCRPQEGIIWVLQIEGATGLADAGFVEIVKYNRQIEVAGALFILVFLRINETSISDF